MILLVSGATRDVDGLAAPSIGRLFTPGAGNAGADDRPYGVDNGAWRGFDARAFERLLSRLRPGSNCLFVAAPDVVSDHEATLRLFAPWRARLRRRGFPIAFVVQNGCTVDRVPWRSCDAIFIGGDTAFKLSADVDRVLERAAELRKWRHIGRVNTRRRLAHFTGRADSIDGSGFSQWPKRIALAARWLEELERQPRLFG